MNSEKETGFVNRFIKKNRRERLLYELKNGKKRRDALSRFCHNSLAILEESRIVKSGKEISSEEIRACFPKKEKTAYLLSYAEEDDGKEYALEEALALFMDCNMAAILLCADYAVIKEEQECGAPLRIILRGS